jgi:peptidoglycan/LPS O-acetylase OafA/YrhL
MEQTVSSGGHARRGDVQGLRCVAVLFVVLFHAGVPLRGGFTGVDVFFAISGFVITGTLAREWARHGRIDLPHFYVRRIKRLLPALAVMLVTVAVVGVLATPVSAQRIGALTGEFAALFAANGYIYRLPTGYFDLEANLNPLLHTWTLGVEEQFYVVFPLLLLGGWMLARRRARPRSGSIVVLVVAGASIVSFALAWLLPSKLGFYASPARAWEFGAGALVALLAPLIVRMPQRYADGLAAAGALALVATGLLISGTSQLAVTYALVPVAGTCALLVAGTAASTRVTRLLGTPAMVWIGDLSYSWYLWHWPLIVFATAMWPLAGWAPPAAAAASLLVAWLSYRYVENPVRRNPRIRGRSALALAGVCIVIPILACAGALAAYEYLSRTAPALASARESQRHSLGQVRGCFGAFRPAGPKAAACTLRVPASRGSVVLVGDSVATSLTEPFVEAARREGFDATVATFPGCPFVDLIPRGRFPRPGCQRYYDVSMAELVRATPSLVVFANTSTYVWDDALSLASPVTRRATNRSADKARLWGQARAAGIHRLNDAGVPVLVVVPTPIAAALPSSCAVVRVLTRSCSTSRPRSAVDREGRRLIAADQQAVREARDAATVDFTDVLCGTRTCPSVRGDVTINKDRMHLSVAGARLLTPRFAQAIGARAKPQAGH